MLQTLLAFCKHTLEWYKQNSSLCSLHNDNSSEKKGVMFSGENAENWKRQNSQDLQTKRKRCILKIDCYSVYLKNKIKTETTISCWK